MTIILVTAIPVTDMTVPHAIETCYGSALHCHWHDVHEPMNNVYRVCLECSHVYKTPAELLTAWITELGYSWSDNGTPSAETIPACAYCGHDW